MPQLQIKFSGVYSRQQAGSMSERNGSDIESVGSDRVPASGNQRRPTVNITSTNN